jgi:hypothetical protein
MTVAELIEELKTYDQSFTVVVVGSSYSGGEPEYFESEPFAIESTVQKKVVIQT